MASDRGEGYQGGVAYSQIEWCQRLYPVFRAAGVIAGVSESVSENVWRKLSDSETDTQIMTGLRRLKITSVS